MKPLTEDRLEAVVPYTKESPTASSVGNPLYGTSGVMAYRCTMISPIGTAMSVVVEAGSGDEASLKALDKMPGGKITRIDPASSPQLVRELS